MNIVPQTPTTINVTVKFPDTDIPALVDAMDKADGTPDQKIGKDVWNQYNDILGTKQIKNFKTAEDASDIITKYFDKIASSNNSKAIPLATVAYTKFMQMALNMMTLNRGEQVLKLLQEINEQLQAENQQK